MYSRVFGNSREDAAAFAGSFLGALQAKGIVGCLKHFPGLAAAEVDSHEELPVIKISDAELFETDLFPYRELIGSANVGAIMAAHAGFPNVNLQEMAQNGKLLPSSLSYNFVTTLLRGDLAFDGLVITDDLEMGAIVKNFGIGSACKMALSAGVDMVAICADPNRIREGHRALTDALAEGSISESRLDESINRISAMKEKLPVPTNFDRDRMNELSDQVAALNESLGLS